MENQKIEHICLEPWDMSNIYERLIYDTEQSLKNDIKKKLTHINTLKKNITNLKDQIKDLERENETLRNEVDFYKNNEELIRLNDQINALKESIRLCTENSETQDFTLLLVNKKFEEEKIEMEKRNLETRQNIHSFFKKKRAEFEKKDQIIKEKNDENIKLQKQLELAQTTIKDQEEEIKNLKEQLKKNI